MNEDEIPVIELNLAGELFEATPFNAELYTFVGKTVLESGQVIENSTRNHVFLQREAPRTNEAGHEVTNGTYLFKPETVSALARLMLQHDFPARINQRAVPKSDEDAYQQYVDMQVSNDSADDYFPDDWN